MARQLGARLGERDRELLLAAARLRLVTGGQLQRLLFAGPEASSTNSRVARRCLERLTAQRLLQRLERRVGGVRAGSSSYVYAVTHAGAEAVGWQVGRGRVREPSLAFLTHQLGVAEVFVRLHEARWQGAFLDLTVLTEPDCWRPLDDGSGGILKPDLHVLASLADHERLAFVEIDNGTEHAAALSRKAALYAAHYSSGREQQLEGVFPEVLWLAPDAARVSQLQAAFARSSHARLHQLFSNTEALIEYLSTGQPP